MTLLGWCALVILEVTIPDYLPRLLLTLRPPAVEPYDSLSVSLDDARQFFARCPAGHRQAWLVVHVFDRAPLIIEVTEADRRRLGLEETVGP